MPMHDSDMDVDDSHQRGEHDVRNRCMHETQGRDIRTKMRRRISRTSLGGDDTGEEDDQLCFMGLPPHFGMIV